jgi:hypothetical protein
MMDNFGFKSDTEPLFVILCMYSGFTFFRSAQESDNLPEWRAFSEKGPLASLRR